MISDIRHRVERSFEGFGRFVYRNRIKTLLVMLVIVTGMVSQLPKVRIDTSTEGFLHEKDPALMQYNAFRDQFGRDEMVLIAIKPRDIFDLKFLRKLEAFHNDLVANVPHMDDITSLINARNTRGAQDRLIVEDLLETFPKNAKDLAALKARVLANPIYRNMLVSEDGTFTTVLIKTNSYSSMGGEVDVLAGFDDAGDQPTTERMYLTDEENGEVVIAVRKIVAQYQAPDFPLYVAGSPVVTHDLKRTMLKDMRKFMAMAVLIIGTVLYLLFRRISGVVLPLVTVILTLLSTVGLMGLTGTAIKMPTQILPSFLLAVSVGASVHVLAIFYQRFQSTGSQEDSIVYALGHSGLAIIMTSVTTAAGLASFATAKIAPIADLGIFASIGVMLSLLYTIVLLPALLSLITLKTRDKPKDKARHASMDRILKGIADFSTGHYRPVLVVSFVVIGAALFFATQIRFSHNPLTWLNKRMPVREATTVIDRELKGSISLEVVTDTKKVNGLYDPANLNRLEALGKEISAIDNGPLFVGKTLSVADMLKEINQALHENRKEHHAIPQNERLIAQEFLLFENSGSDDLEDSVDSQFTKSRFTVKVPWLDAVQYRDFISDIEQRFEHAFGDDANITITGMIPLFGATVHAAMLSAAQSYSIAGVVITIMMVVFIGSFRMGLASMIPNLAPIILTMGIMGVFDMPMDMFTMLIGSIAIGLVVDDTIHFMHNFRRYYHETHDPREAVRRTLFTTGRAMLVTSVVLSLGFFIFMFASMNNLFNFGLLTGFTIMMALLADFLIAPALMMVIRKPREWE
jgi:hydrophobe/amphiphile efflux-3 (HAE3) family protein